MCRRGGSGDVPPLKKENERKKKYLLGYLHARREEERIREEIAMLRIRKRNPSAVMDGLPHGSGGSDLSDYAARLDELLRALGYEQMKAICRYAEIRKNIILVKNDTYREILFSRYLLGRKWEQIALDLSYEFRYILKLHGRALIEFQMPEQEDTKRHTGLC